MLISIIASLATVLPASVLAMPYEPSKRDNLPGDHNPHGSVGCDLVLGGSDDSLGNIPPCSVASMPYNSSDWYHEYTSYTAQNCAAMVHCSNQASYEKGISGAEIIQA